MSAAIQTLNNLKQAITNAFEKAQDLGLLSKFHWRLQLSFLHNP